jgi:hypothetical protein
LPVALSEVQLRLLPQLFWGRLITQMTLLELSAASARARFITPDFPLRASDFFRVGAHHRIVLCGSLARPGAPRCRA